ncbi:MAG: hypothetical protein ACRCVE_05980 [Plesiomonas sp.]
MLAFVLLLMFCLFSIVGMKGIGQRLYSNLVLDIKGIKRVLNWNPPVTFSQGIKRTVDDY